MNFECTKTFKKKNIQLYVFCVCDNIEHIKKIVSKELDIKKLPTTFFKSKSNELFRTLYFDNFEVMFIFMNKKCNHESLYNTYGQLGKYVNNYEGNILIYLDQKSDNSIQNQVLSFILGTHQTNDYKTNKNNEKRTIYFYHCLKKYNQYIENGLVHGDVQNHIRDLNNTPANILNADKYEEIIKKQKYKDIKMEVLNEAQLKKLGMNLILAVNAGSAKKARMILLHYKSKDAPKKCKPTVFVGKGVMFDSGGYNIKLHDFHDMKTDMTGSSTVYGLMNLISYHKLKGHYIGLLPIVENMVNENASRPGDIVKSYNGKTVEIINTDAEGRLIMADALAYSEKYKPQCVIDISTLTGGNEYFFGGKASSIMGNSNKLIQKMIQCGKENNEHLWEIPMWSEYVEATKSKLADYRNDSGEIKAGTIMAGAFLSNFIPKNTDWLHIDVAGADYHENGNEIRFSGSNGVMLNSLLCFVKNKNYLD